MIKHIVVFKTKATDDASARENAEKLAGMLQVLPSQIPEIYGMDVGVNAEERDAPEVSDVSLYSIFEDQAAYNTYKDHPAHVKVIEFVAKAVSERRVVDYES